MEVLAKISTVAARPEPIRPSPEWYLGDQACQGGPGAGAGQGAGQGAGEGAGEGAFSCMPTLPPAFPALCFCHPCSPCREVAQRVPGQMESCTL